MSKELAPRTTMPSGPDHPGLTPEKLCQLLDAAIAPSARAADLVLKAPELVDYLFPPANYPGISMGQRAVWTEELIRAVIAELEPEIGKFLEIVLGLARGTLRMTVNDRYEKAGDVFGVTGRTASSKVHRDRVLLHLAVAIYRKMTVPT